MLKAFQIAGALATFAQVNAQLIDFGAEYPICQNNQDANTCVTEDMQSGNSMEFIYAGDDAAKTVTTDTLTFDKVVGHALVNNVLTHFDILAVTSSVIDCTSSRALLMDKTTGLIGTKAMTNADDQTCRVDWDEVFQEYSDFNDKTDLAVVFEFNALTANPADSFKMVFMEDTTPIVTKYQLEQPSFVTMDFYATATSVNLSLQRNQFVPDTCQYPPTIAVNLAGCPTNTFIATQTTAGEPAYAVAITQTALDGCQSSAASNGDSISFTMDMTATFDVPEGCSTERAVLTQDAINFSINFGAVATATGTIQGDIYNVYARVTGYSNEPCNGRLGPMGKPKIDVEIRGPVGSNAAIPASNIIMDDVAFALDGEVVCSDDLATLEEVCEGTWTALECIPMTNTDATCVFDQVGDVTGSATWQWLTVPAGLTLEDNVDEIGIKANLVNQILTICSVPAVQVDLNGAFNVAVEIEQASTMFEPLVTNIHFVDLDDTAAVTLKINTVEVSAGGYTQTFTIADKLALMGRERSKYYSDSHFCRYEDVDNVCAPFYSTQSNALTLSDAATYGTPGGYKSCQLNEARAKDVFTFTPYNYVFSKIQETEITFTIKVTAEIDDCSTAAARRLRALAIGGDRALMTDEELAALDPDAKKIVDNYAVVVVRMPATNMDESSSIMLIIIIVVVLVLLFSSCCFWFFFVARRNKQRKEAEEEVRAQQKLGEANPHQIVIN